MANQVPLVIADFETQVSGAIAAGDTSFTLASATDDDGNALAAGKYCFTVNNGRSNKQYLLGQLNGTTVTSVVSVDRRGNETSGAASSARSGSPVMISDFATIQRVADILRGQVDLDGSNPVSYDAEPSLANREELATVGYVLDQVSGGTVDFDNQIINSVNAGETVAAGELLYFKTSDQEWYKCDADTASTVENVQLGIALGAGSDGASISGGVQIAGVYTTTGLTAGSTYYASNTAGAYSTSAGTTSVVIGLALSTTRLFLVPRYFNSVTSNEKDALAGGDELGTPSSSNKFLTENARAQVVTFTSSGTWTKDTGLQRVRVQAWGGGGAGVSVASTNSGGGGGGGGYSEAWFEASELGSSETVTVGAGGATSGAAGGNTTFGSLLTAFGGSGGSGATGGNGGVVQTGETTLRGAGGSTSAGGVGVLWGGAGGGGGGAGGNALFGGAGGGGNATATASSGGTSIYGGNGGAGNHTGAAATAGTQPGGGGGSTNGSGTFGAGAAGQVIVTEYYI